MEKLVEDGKSFSFDRHLVRSQRFFKSYVDISIKQIVFSLVVRRSSLVHHRIVLGRVKDKKRFKL